MVCEFIGNVNAFDGTVVEDLEGHAIIHSPDLEQKIYVGHGVSTSVQDKSITYAIRPEKLLVSTVVEDEIAFAVTIEENADDPSPGALQLSFACAVAIRTTLSPCVNPPISAISKNSFVSDVPKKHAPPR